MKKDILRLRYVGCFLVALAWMFGGRVEPLHADGMPAFAGKNWGEFKPLLEEALTPERTPDDYEVRGLRGQVLSGPEPGDAVVDVSPAVGTDLSDPSTEVFVTVARYKLPNYEHPDHPIELWAAAEWLTSTDSSINIQKIIKLPSEEVTYPPPLDWWGFVLSLVKLQEPDGTWVAKHTGDEIPVGATVALFVTDPPGGSIFDHEDSELLKIAAVIIGLIGLAAFLALWRTYKAAKPE